MNRKNYALQAGAFLALLVTASIAACSDAGTPVMTPERVALRGSEVIRHPQRPGEKEWYRFVKHGTHNAMGGCTWSSAGEPETSARSYSQWMVEENPTTCTAIIARGDYIDPRSFGGPGYKSLEVTTSTSRNGQHARASSGARSDTWD